MDYFNNLNQDFKDCPLPHLLDAVEFVLHPLLRMQEVTPENVLNPWNLLCSNHQNQIWSSSVFGHLLIALGRNHGLLLPTGHLNDLPSHLHALH